MSTTPRTIAVPLHPNQPTASYSLASGLAQFVESVYIEVDNTAGADARPLLTLSEQSGVVIAKKRQGDSITGGTSGSATWALRLTDEGGASTATGFIKYDFANTGNWLQIATTGTGPNGDGVFFNDSGHGFKFVSTDPVFGEMLVQVPFFHVLTSNVDFRLLDNGTTTWNADNASQTFTTAYDLESGQLDFVITQAGNTFNVRDHTNAVIFSLTG